MQQLDYAYMQPHQQRVVEEHRELRDRIHKLKAFKLSTQFALLDREDRRLLIHQLELMQLYLNTLEARIERF